MKPIYNSLVLTAMTLSVSLALKAQVNDGESITESAVLASSLDGLKVELVSPNVTGARDLIASGECVIDGADLNISLNTVDWLKGATYSVRVSAVFGTQTVVLYVLNVEVPRYEALANETQEYEDTVTVVSTYGDGDKSGADATVYAKDGDGNAHITKPLSIGDGVASGEGAVASGRTDGVDSQINASGEGAVASGYTGGENSQINASGDGAVASGHTGGDNSQINASGAGAVASGYATSTSGNVVASGDGSQAFGIGVQATQEGQMAVGKCNVVDEDDSFAFIVGNGADDEHRSNAFAVTKSGELALFKADGTPIILTPTLLEAIIALV